jgi:hypothetical protein
LGVTLVAIAVWVQGLLYVASGLYYGFGLTDETFLAEHGGETVTWLRLLGNILGGLVLFVVTSGILRGNAGTRIILTVFLAVSFVGSVIVASFGYLVPLEIVAAVLAVIAIVLLWTPRATEFFRLQNAAGAGPSASLG